MFTLLRLRARSPSNGNLSPREARHTPNQSDRCEAPLRIIPDKPCCDLGHCQCSKLPSLALFLRNCSSAWADAPGNAGHQLSPPSVRLKILPQPVDPGGLLPAPPRMRSGAVAFADGVGGWSVDSSQFLVDSAGSGNRSGGLCWLGCHTTPWRPGWLRQKAIIVLVLEKSAITCQQGLLTALESQRRASPQGVP